MPVVLCGCETWSLALREEHRLRVFENKVLRRTFGPTREEERGMAKNNNEELNDLYSSPSTVHVIKSRRMRWAGHVSHRGESSCVYRVLVGKPVGKRPLGRTENKRKINIKTDLQELGCRSMDWIGLAQNRDR